MRSAVAALAWMLAAAGVARADHGLLLEDSMSVGSVGLHGERSLGVAVDGALGVYVGPLALLVTGSSVSLTTPGGADTADVRRLGWRARYEWVLSNEAIGAAAHTRYSAWLEVGNGVQFVDWDFRYAL